VAAPARRRRTIPPTADELRVAPGRNDAAIERAATI
jgi:hypothetical protein